MIPSYPNPFFPFSLESLHSGFPLHQYTETIPAKATNEFHCVTFQECIFNLYLFLLTAFNAYALFFLQYRG
jgi:hypothetical protein